ncbi:MAG: hypothetical protein IPJ13_19585 [Saprospiraceae bacterium]|nr:hypothetical protein [Saprospiraceae bacterium]
MKTDQDFEAGFLDWLNTVWNPNGTLKYPGCTTSSQKENPKGEIEKIFIQLWVLYISLMRKDTACGMSSRWKVLYVAVVSADWSLHSAVSDFQ